VTAVHSKEVRFRMLHEKDGGRVLQKRVCSVDGAEVPWDEVGKGFELGPDEFVLLAPEELEAVQAEKSETIDITDFVSMTDIDPIYFEKPYYLVPAKGAAKPYALLVEAMRRSGRVAIARMVMRQKEHLVAVRVVEDALSMTTLLYHDELVQPAELQEEAATKKTAPAEKEIGMAEQLIDALTTDFEPQKYKDEHRARVLALVEAKAEGKHYKAPPKAEAKKPADLESALKASLDAAKKRHAGGAGEASA
jgi:DNA end-binding protein Ku